MNKKSKVLFIYIYIYIYDFYFFSLLHTNTQQQQQQHQDNNNHYDGDNDDDDDDDDYGEHDIDVDDVSSDEDEFYHYTFNYINNDDYYVSDAQRIESRGTPQLTKFKHVDSIEYFIKDYDDCNPTQKLIGIYDLNPNSKKIKCLPSQHFFCLGKRDGFYMRFGFWTGSEFKDYKLVIPWVNVCKISYSKLNRISKSIRIGIKYCVKPSIFKIEYNESNKSKKSKTYKRKKTFIRQWKPIECSQCPKSVQDFIKHPKIVMKLIPHRYQLKKIKQSIHNHSKIVKVQIMKKFSQFQKNISYKIDQLEKDNHQRIYRACYTPCLQSHDNRHKEMDAFIQIMFNAANGRICASQCGNTIRSRKVGFFEQHPICLQSNDTVDTCDSDILKSIHNDRFKPNHSSSSRRLSYVFYVMLCYVMKTNYIFYVMC